MKKGWKKRRKKPAEDVNTEVVQSGILANLSSDIVFHQILPFFSLHYLFKTVRLVGREWNLFIIGKSSDHDHDRNDQNSSRYSLFIPKNLKREENFLDSLMTCIEGGYFRNIICKLQFNEFDSFCKPNVVRKAGFNEMVPQIRGNLLDEGFPLVETISINIGHSDSSILREGFCKNKLEKLKSLEIVVSKQNLSYFEIFSCDFMRNLTFLNLHNSYVDDEIMLRIGECPLTNLESLDLSYNNITQLGALRLSKSQHLSKLKCLDFTYNDIGDEGLRYICESEAMCNISKLLLEFNRISDVEPLLKSSNMKNLSELDLCRCSIDLKSLMSLISCSNLPKLERISLYHALLIGSELTPSYTISKSIEELDLSSSKLNDVGFQLLLNSIKYNSITKLDIRNNEIGNKGLEYLSQCKHLNNLKVLDISFNDSIDKNGFIYFIEHVPMPNINELRMRFSEKFSESMDQENIREIVSHYFPNVSLIII